MYGIAAYQTTHAESVWKFLSGYILKCISFIFIWCECFSACMHTYRLHASCPGRSERAAESLQLEVTISLNQHLSAGM